MTITWIGHPSCPACLAATKIQRNIQAKVAVVLALVQEVCGKIREDNRQRWVKFAKMCNLPFIGRPYFRHHRMPELLTEPEYFKEGWFWEAQGVVESMLEEMYKILANDPYQHMHSMPAFYKNPVRGYEMTQTTLGMLMRLEYPPAMPPEFDLAKRARELGAYTMCAATYKVVPVEQCGAGTFVRKEKPTTVHIRRDVMRHHPQIMENILADLSR